MRLSNCSATCCNDWIKGELPARSDGRYFKPISMLVKERVMTTLFQSADRKTTVESQAASSSLFCVQVMPTVGIFSSRRKDSAARTASEVLPEREMTIARRSESSLRGRFRCNKRSDAGRALAGSPVSWLHELAAASAK